MTSFESTTQNPEQLDVATPAYEFMEQKLGAEGMALLDRQLQVWQQLNERPLHSPLRDSLRTGDTTLPQGTLLHGMGMHALFDEAALSSVARLGIVSGELMGVHEDAETHGCADFFKVPADTTVDQYMKYSKETVQVGNIRRGRGERLLGRGVVFIVDPNAEGMNELTDHDGYTDPEMQEFVHPPSGRNPMDTAAILGGVPKGAIAGIIVNPKLLENPATLETVRTYFPDTPVLDHEGTLH
jgi:hypothetical protein